MSEDFDIYLPAIQATDPRAFARWVGAVEQELRRALRPFAKSVDTEMVFQEAVLRVWTTAHGVEKKGPNSLLRYAITTARNFAFSEARKRAARPEEVDALERSLAEPATFHRPGFPDPLLRRVIALCREKLPAKPAQALMARLSSEGRDDDEALAMRLGMKLNTFLQNFTRARKLLAACLKEHGVDLDAELS